MLEDITTENTRAKEIILIRDRFFTYLSVPCFCSYNWAYGVFFRRDRCFLKTLYDTIALYIPLYYIKYIYLYIISVLSVL